MTNFFILIVVGLGFMGVCERLDTIHKDLVILTEVTVAHGSK